jgi:hypothetical protein
MSKTNIIIVVVAIILIVVLYLFTDKVLEILESFGVM